MGKNNLSFDVTESTAEMISDIAQYFEISREEVLRKSLQVMLLYADLKKTGGKLLIETDGKIKELLVC